MSLSGTSIKDQIKNRQVKLDVAQKVRKHLSTLAKYPIVETEVAPHDSSLVSLGIYNSKKQPRGFCIEYDFEIEAPDLVKTNVTTTKVAGGFYYLLQVVNNTNRTLSAEVRVL